MRTSLSLVLALVSVSATRDNNALEMSYQGNATDNPDLMPGTVAHLSVIVPMPKDDPSLVEEQSAAAAIPAADARKQDSRSREAKVAAFQQKLGTKVSLSVPVPNTDPAPSPTPAASQANTASKASPASTQG